VSSALLAALALGVVSPVPRPLPGDDPPIRVKLSDEHFERGDRARVRVRAAEDGYLLVLRADADGRVRVLYPLDPEDDGRIRGGREFEVRSRGDREAFAVDDREGSGSVLAAWSDQPFRFDDFTRNGHWDYRALTPERLEDDAEAGLLDLVDRMSDDRRYDYDVAFYHVGARPYPRYRAGHDPWFWGCWGCGPWFYGPRWGWGWGLGVTIGPGHGHPWGRRH
jgi:hypothetical protein